MLRENPNEHFGQPNLFWRVTGAHCTTAGPGAHVSNSISVTAKNSHLSRFWHVLTLPQRQQQKYWLNKINYSNTALVPSFASHQRGLLPGFFTWCSILCQEKVENTLGQEVIASLNSSTFHSPRAALIWKCHCHLKLQFLKASLFLWEQVIVRTLPPLSSTKIINPQLQKHQPDVRFCAKCAVSLILFLPYSPAMRALLIFSLFLMRKRGPQNEVKPAWPSSGKPGFYISSVISVIVLVSKTLWKCNILKVISSNFTLIG